MDGDIGHAWPLRPLPLINGLELTSSSSGINNFRLPQRSHMEIQFTRENGISVPLTEKLLYPFPQPPNCNYITKIPAAILFIQNNNPVFQTLALYPPNPLRPLVRPFQNFLPSSTQKTVLAIPTSKPRSPAPKPSV